MALELKIDIKAMHPGLKAALTVLPAVLIAVPVIILLVLPRRGEIKRIRVEIRQQENEIAKDEAKAAGLSALKIENEKLKTRLGELQAQLPEEKEVSGLLKQVSDFGINAGLKIVLWKPEQKKDHPSGMIYEIPVAVELSGSYHNLGRFFSSLTKLSRIVNISDLKLAEPLPDKADASLKITFRATTFSALSEAEIAAKASEKKAPKT